MTLKVLKNVLSKCHLTKPVVELYESYSPLFLLKRAEEEMKCLVNQGHIDDELDKRRATLIIQLLVLYIAKRFIK